MNQRVALITGGTGGLGTAICKKLSKQGYKVAANYVDTTRHQEWIKQMKSEGYDIYTVQGDVSSFDSCAEMVKKITAEVGPIDIVVNNAGITRDTTLRKMDKAQWDAVLNVNLDSVFNVTRNVIEGMLERGFGRVINISSINAQKGQFGQTNYSAAKAGMHGFTKALAQEVAKKGITVNTVSPGYVATEMVMEVKEEIRNQIIAQIPVGRLGKPEEIAALITYLVSDEASFITGADIAINGGQHMS